MGKPTLKIWKKIWKIWMEVRILTLAQLTDEEDEFLTYVGLRDKYHLTDINQWQYLQLQYLLTEFGPTSFSPKIQEQLVKSLFNNLLNKNLLVFVDICHKFDMQMLRS